jgi:hypothetical protein
MPTRERSRKPRMHKVREGVFIAIECGSGSGPADKGSFDFARLLWTQARLLLSKLHPRALHFCFVGAGRQTDQQWRLPNQLAINSHHGSSRHRLQTEHRCILSRPLLERPPFASPGLFSVPLTTPGCLYSRSERRLVTREQGGIHLVAESGEDCVVARG